MASGYVVSFSFKNYAIIYGWNAKIYYNEFDCAVYSDGGRRRKLKTNINNIPLEILKPSSIQWWMRIYGLCLSFDLNSITTKKNPMHILLVIINGEFFKIIFIRTFGYIRVSYVDGRITISY